MSSPRRKKKPATERRGDRPRRPPRRSRTLYTGAGGIAALFAIVIGWAIRHDPNPVPVQSPAPPNSSVAPPPRPASVPFSDTEKITGVVEYVVDGDTISVRHDGKVEKVRYLGIDTPESIASDRKPIGFYGAEASRRNHELVEGRTVVLEIDGRRTDVYDRLLAYVWVGDVLVNLQLLEEGCAEVYRKADYIRRREEFDRAEDAARGSGLGMWDDAARRRWTAAHD